MNGLLRVFNRSLIQNVNTKARILCTNTFQTTETKRSFAYHYKGEKQYDPEKTIEYEISEDPEEWKFVERLLTSNLINDPLPRDSYPSGWNPPDPTAESLPYFVRRTKNHMIPLYLKVSQRGLKKRTILRYIRGDIFLLQEELTKWLEEKSGKHVGVRVDELCSKITLRGDYLHYTLEFLKEKGF